MIPILSDINTPSMAPGIIEASGVLIGLVVVALMVIKAGSKQATESGRSLERVVEVMAKGMRDDLRAYQSQAHADAKATQSRIESIDSRLLDLRRDLSETRSHHEDRLRALEDHAGFIRAKLSETH